MGYCVSCDNRHGCKNGIPLCQTPPYEKRGGKDLHGRRLMQSIGELDACRRCNYFKICWKLEEYERLTGK